jgi:signal transduction histidine kinase
MQAMLRDQVKHMARLIEDLLDVSRANTGKMRLERADIDIVQIIHAAIEVCQAMMNNRSLRFTATVPEHELWVHGDAVRLAQVLHNLLTNAAKYTPCEGAVELHAEVVVGAIRISVRDTGIGISSKLLFKVFEPYVQDARAIAFNGTGLGIGLTVVRELVDAHGGTVTCTSAGEGLGSEFVVTLPLVQAAPAAS